MERYQIEANLNAVSEYMENMPEHNDTDALFTFVTNLCSLSALIPECKKEAYILHKSAEYDTIEGIDSKDVKAMGSTIFNRKIDCYPNVRSAKALYEKAVSMEYVVKNMMDTLRSVLSYKKTEMEFSKGVSNTNSKQYL